MNINRIIDILIKVIIIILIATAISNIFIFKQNLIYEFNDKLILTYAIIFIIMIVAITCIFNKIKDKYNKKIKLIILFVLFIIQVIYAYLIQRRIGTDCGVIYISALKLITGDFMHKEYFSIYTNNIFLLLFFEIFFRIIFLLGSDQYLIIQIIFNIIIIDTSIVYSQKICEKLFGSKYSIISMILTIPILAITPYIAVVYSDTLSLIFPVGILYNYLCYKELPRIKNIIFIGIFGIIGFLIKPTNVIILIAIAIIEGINIITQNEKIKEDWKTYLKNLMIVLSIFLLINVSFIIYRDIRLKKYISKEDIENNRFPYTHFIMMGIKPVEVDGAYYGMYYKPDVQASKARKGVQEKKDYNIQQIKERLNKLGVKGYIKYLYDKYTCFMSDGTFYYGREGEMYTSDPIIKDELAQKIQEYSYSDREGYTNYTINIFQAYWGIILILVIIGIIIKLNKQDRDEIKVARLSIIGIIIFLLIFEARSRQLINYLPMFIILSTYAIKEVNEKIKSAK